jgi:hypothetical protein
MAFSNRFIKTTSIMVASSITRQSNTRKYSSLHLKAKTARLNSSKRWTVLAYNPVDSERRLAALPVGAQILIKMASWGPMLSVIKLLSTSFAAMASSKMVAGISSNLTAISHKFGRIVTQRPSLDYSCNTCAHQFSMAPDLVMRRTQKPDDSL